MLQLKSSLYNHLEIPLRHDLGHSGAVSECKTLGDIRGFAPVSAGATGHAASRIIANGLGVEQKPWPRGDDTLRHTRHGTHRGNQLGSRAKCSRNKFSRCLLIFPHLRFDHALASRVGMQAGSGKTTSRIRGIGRHWRDWLAFRWMLEARTA